jgi:hypothetical protein
VDEVLATAETLQAISVSEVKRALARRVRRCREYNIIDQTTAGSGEVAIYALSDPRDVQAVRYLGQTRNPVSRYTQHINAARLWVPEERPWWIKREALRPLYTWIRGLYFDERRLPSMMLIAWTQASEARQEEGRHIREYLRHQLPLLNRETAVFHRKSQLSPARVAALRAL